MSARDRVSEIVRGDRNVVIGIATLAIGALFIVGALSGVIAEFFNPSDTRIVRASFQDTQQLRAGNDVRLDGVNVGEIDRIELSPDGRTSEVWMDVEQSAGELYADAEAIVRFKTVLGGSFYIDLERGTAGRGALTSAIPADRTSRQTELDDITPVAEGASRKGFQSLPAEVADALDDAQAPRGTFDALNEAAPGVEHGVGALRGEDLDRDLRTLVRETSKMTEALDRPTEELRGLVSGAGATLQTTAARASELQSAIRQSPGTSDRIRSTLTRLDGTLDLADPLIADLQGPARQVRQTFAELNPPVARADRLLRSSVPLLRSLRPAMTSLAGVARRGLPLVDELQPSIDRVDEVLLPSLSEIDEGTGKSTAVMIGGAVAGLASGAGGQMDALGHFIRFPATSGSSAISSLPCQTYFNNPDKLQMIACQELSKALEIYGGYDPLGLVDGTRRSADEESDR